MHGWFIQLVQILSVSSPSIASYIPRLSRGAAEFRNVLGSDMSALAIFCPSGQWLPLGG